MTESDEILARNKAWNRAGMEKIRASQRAYSEAHPGWRRNHALMRRYGLSLERYEEMEQAQNYCCAVCGRNRSEFKQNLAVDHDHTCCPGEKTCGKCIRGLLCPRCNMSEGFMKTAENAMKLAMYMKSFETESAYLREGD